MRIYTRKQKEKRSGNESFFGDYGEIPLGISTVQLTDNKIPFKDFEHYHQAGQEIYVVLTGEINLRVSDKTITLNPDKAVMVDPGEKHFIESINQYPCTVISICTVKDLNDKVISVDAIEKFQ